jgi:hypothetical protein
MNTQSSWEAQTQELLERTDQKLKEIQEEMDEKMQPHLDRRWALIQALEAYRELMGTTTMQTARPLSKEDIQGKSQIEILKLIAGRNDNLLVVRTAIKLMKEANIFGNPDNADAMVYSILSRSEDFHRVGRGVYKLNGVHKPKTRHNKSKVRKPSLPGLKDAIKNLKANNPQITKNEVLELLIKGGFDFRDRNPNKSVTRAWLNLKGKVPEQKPLEIIVPDTLVSKILSN